MTRPDNFRLHTTAQRGRLTDAEKHRLQNLLPQYAVTESFLKNPPQMLEVELGMGNGLAMLERAKLNPTRHYLGCELYMAGIATLLYHLQSPNTLIPQYPNIHIFQGDARDLLAQLPQQSTDRLLLPHPDPWPKARHHKRRLLQNDFLDAVHRVLKPNAEFWFITDWPDYADYARELLAARPDFQTTELPQPDWWIQTKYQQKAQKEGRTNTYLRAVKK